MESPNSHVVVEVGLDEIPSILGFNFRMFEVENVKLPNLGAVVAIGFDEIPLTSGVDFKVPYSPAVKVNPFHVIFKFEQNFDHNTFQIEVPTLSFSVLD
jgi:hypothetical protein